MMARTCITIASALRRSASWWSRQADGWLSLAVALEEGRRFAQTVGVAVTLFVIAYAVGARP